MTSIEQAKKIYEICVRYALLEQFLKYSQVIKYLGYDKPLPGYAIKYGLELAWIGCSYHKLPALTALVVNDSTGEPSPTGFSVSDWREHAQKVFEQKVWPAVNEIDWDYIWKNRVQLSNSYGTTGYWGK